MNTHDEQDINKVRNQRDDAIKIAMLILEHSTVNSNESSKHVHKYAVNMLEFMRHTIPYPINTKV